MIAFFLYSNIFLLPKPDVATKKKFFDIHDDKMIFQTNYIALSALAQWRTLCTFSCSFENLLFLC